MCARHWQPYWCLTGRKTQDRGTKHKTQTQEISGLRSRQGGLPHSADGGGTPSKVWTGGTPSQVQKGGRVPHPRSKQEGDTPSNLGWGIPPSNFGWGIPPSKTGWGTSPSPIRRLISKACTSYAAGGVPLAFTQEDFLVTKDMKLKFELLKKKHRLCKEVFMTFIMAEHKIKAR